MAVQHASLTGVNAIHVPYAGTYANAAARTAATDVAASDLGKVFRQLDSNTLWMLTAVNPLTWKAVGGGIPAGGIIIWSGLSTAIPAGWALCDGTNGTPDLRNRFVVGAGDEYTAGSTGGSKTGDVNGSVSGNTGATTLTVAQMPSHNHGTGNTGAAIGPNMNVIKSSETAAAFGTLVSSYTGGNGSHTHSMAGTLNATANTIPPYYALCYIMKLAE